MQEKQQQTRTHGLRAVSPAASSVASSSLDEVCCYLPPEGDDQMSSLGEVVDSNRQDSTGDPSLDAQFLKQVAELNKQMSAELEGLARQQRQHQLGSHSPKESPPDRPGRRRKGTRKHRDQRRLTLELLTSDDEANEFTDQRSSAYLEPMVRRNRKAEEPNLRSSFETLYGFGGAETTSADGSAGLCDETDGLVVALLEVQEMQPRKQQQKDQKFQDNHKHLKAQKLPQEHQKQPNEQGPFAPVQWTPLVHDANKVTPKQQRQQQQEQQQQQQQLLPIVATTRPSNSWIGWELQSSDNCSQSKSSCSAATSVQPTRERVPTAQSPQPRQRNSAEPCPASKMAGSQAAKRRDRMQQQQQQQQHQQRLHQLNNHVSGVNFSLSSSPMSSLNAPPPPEPPPRQSRAIRFRSGSFSDFNYYNPAPRQQSSNLEIGVLLQRNPSSRRTTSKEARGELVVTRLLRVDRAHPVSELELMCRAMRLDDPDLMEGAALRDMTSAAPAAPRRWSENVCQPSEHHHHHQQQQQQHHRQFLMSRPAPDAQRDDQSRRRVAATSSGQRPVQPTNFIGRASDGERARQQGWWIRARSQQVATEMQFHGYLSSACRSGSTNVYN